MAEMLSQDDIDALLAESIEVQAAPAVSEQSAADKMQTPKSKFFKRPPTPPYRFEHPYKSPVLRPSEFCLNPDAQYDEEATGKVAVWSIDSYAERMKKLNKPGHH